MRAGSVEVRRLRVHGDTEPLRLRLGVERVLGAADLAGTRLPPAAVLVVRTLRDPLPGRVDVSRTGPDRVWEQRVRDDLDDLVVRAARPAAGPADPAAPAVVFADRAELLACAWRDLRHTGRTGSWWWRALRIEDVARLVAALADAAVVVPAVVSALDRAGHLGACTALLGESEAAVLAERVAAAFGRPRLVVDAREQVEAEAPPSPATGATGSARAARTYDAAVPPPRAPAERARAVLVEVCRAVAVAPGPPPPAGRGTVRPGVAPAPAPGPQDATPLVAAPLDRPAHAGPSTRQRSGTAVDVPAARTATAPRARPTPGGAAGRRAPAARTAGPGGEPPSREPGSGADARPPRPGHPDPAAAVTEQPGRVSDDGAVVDTALGGVFHLLQVAQALGLYGDFTTPGTTGIGLGPWDLVTLVATRLGVGSDRDPVWRLLADLQGRHPAVARGRASGRRGRGGSRTPGSSRSRPRGSGPGTAARVPHWSTRPASWWLRGPRWCARASASATTSGGAATPARCRRAGRHASGGSTTSRPTSRCGSASPSASGPRGPVGRCAGGVHACT